MSDKELFSCFECAIAGRETLVELDTNGRCGVCHSDAVLSKHQTESLAIAGAVAQQQVRARVVESVKPETRKYYWIADGRFETIVTWQDATSVADAAAYAFNPNNNHPWYRTVENSDDFRERTLSHSEYCDWLRKH